MLETWKLALTWNQAESESETYKLNYRVTADRLYPPYPSIFTPFEGVACQKYPKISVALQPKPQNLTVPLVLKLSKELPEIVCPRLLGGVAKWEEKKF